MSFATDKTRYHDTLQIPSEQNVLRNTEMQMMKTEGTIKNYLLSLRIYTRISVCVCVCVHTHTIKLLLSYGNCITIYLHVKKCCSFGYCMQNLKVQALKSVLQDDWWYCFVLKGPTVISDVLTYLLEEFFLPDEENENINLKRNSTELSWVEQSIPYILKEDLSECKPYKIRNHWLLLCYTFHGIVTLK